LKLEITLLGLVRMCSLQVYRHLSSSAMVSKL
jgi:hypothetical protein